MVRSFSITYGIPPRPTREALKKIGPRDVSFIPAAAIKIRGAETINKTMAKRISKIRRMVYTFRKLRN